MVNTGGTVQPGGTTNTSISPIIGMLIKTGIISMGIVILIIVMVKCFRVRER
jgi:uncharacterized membrane protein YgaE (UPF0421/DUF939 family)